MAQVRTFIAVSLPPVVRYALARCQERLGAAKTRYVKWMNPEGVHLTLKFLGNVDETTLPHLAQALRESVAGVSAFHLQTGPLGAFPSLKSPRVLWVGLAGALDTLEVLQRAVEEAVTPLGFPPEERSFAPHLTLARVRDAATREDRARLAQLLTQVQMDGSWDIPVGEIIVMKSELARAGATYSSMYVFPLAI
ncbi:MAG: RNA 2',3'-cyclic phosphodiesterase [Dehalococcoidia bacterium]|nr:RNA 2',3'-cyclic phosphodiesterase [Dehalococcoidia bacterium]